MSNTTTYGIMYVVGINQNSTKGVSMRGFKVVNYDKWTSLPEIFSNIKDAKDAKASWHLGEKAVIESFNSKSNRAKVIKERD